MTRELLNLLPSWSVIFIFCVVLAGIALSLYFIIRAKFSHLIESSSNSPLTVLIGILSANYAFLLGFVIVTLWQAHSQAEKETSMESYELRSIMNNSTGVEPIKQKIKNAVGDYAKAVVYDEWPLMRIGEASPRIHQVRQELFKILASYTPKSKQEEIFLSTIVSKLNTLINKRAGRLEFTKSSLSDHLRFILIAGAIFLVVLISFLKSQKTLLHLFSITIVSVLVGFNLGLAFCLDYPFSGDISIGTEAFKIESLQGFFENDSLKASGNS